MKDKKEITEYILKELNDILAILDADEYPETYECASMLYNGGENELPPVYDVATALVTCDERAAMHSVVFDFITELYLYDIELGNENAMNDLGALYYDGRGCNQDFTKAVYYYNMAAENGSRQAQENLGYCYYYGRNMPVDYEKAFNYFALGAFDGHIISLYKIGDMYLNGYYVEKNEKEAFRIFERCMEIMTEEAAPIAAGPVFLRLGNAHLYGKGTDVNAKTALICYQNAERYLFDMVNNGDEMYKKSLEAAVKGQEKAREMLNKELPTQTWLDGIKN